MTYAPHKKDNVQFNAKHNPELDVQKLEPAPGMLIIWRPGAPQEMEKKGLIIIPDGYKYEQMPLCAVVIKVGEGCRTKVGQYAFWRQGGTPQQIPQPIVMHFTDNMPVFYWLKEEDVLGVGEESSVPLNFKLMAEPKSQDNYHKSSITTTVNKDPGKVTIN